MANTNTNMSSDLYISTIVNGFRKAYAPMINVFGVDASPAPAERGYTVNITYIPSGSTPTAFTQANGFAQQTATRVNKAINLSNYYSCNNALTQKEIYDSAQTKLTDTAEANCIEMRNTIFSDCVNYLSSSAVFTSASAALLVPSSSNMSVSKLIDIRTYCAGTLKWSAPAYLLLNSYAYGALLKDTSFASYARGNSDVTQDSLMLRNVSNVYGWKGIYECPAIPFTTANGSSTYNVIGYAVTKQALGIAMRWWSAPVRSVSTTVNTPITDAESGITLGYREIDDAIHDASFAVVTGLWGKEVLDSGGAAIISAQINA